MPTVGVVLLPLAEVVLGNGMIQTMLNNARTHSAVQYNTVPNPAWGTLASDRLGYDGAGRNIAKRYLTGGINATTFAYNNTTPVVGNTTAYDPADNKFYERALHAEERSFLYQPVDNNGNIASPVPGYDSVNRLLQYQRGTLSSTGGYQNAGGGSVATAIALPGADESRNYDLDGLGNWRSTDFLPVGGSPTTTDQRNHNRLNQITQRANGTFLYDGAPGASNGNLAHTGGWNFQYDAINRLIQVQIASTGVTIAAYVYDAANRRIRKAITNGGTTGNIPDGTTDYIWQGSQVVEERNPLGGSGSTDTPIRQYVWGTYIDECIQLTTLTTLGPQNVQAGPYYLLQDLLYRAVALTNSNGSVVEAYDTDAYGNTLIFTAPGTDGVWFTDDDVQSDYGANEIIYCGYRYDPEGPGYYVRNRNYMPFLGRWIQRDPIGYAGGISLYEYVGGRAVNKADPNGTQPMIIGAGIGFAVACGISAAFAWWDGKTACQAMRACVCSGLGGAIAGGTLASFPTITGGCVGSLLGGIAATICQGLWHCAGDPPGPNPSVDPCEYAKTAIAAGAGCLAGALAAGDIEDQNAITQRLVALFGSLFGVDCTEARKCL